MSDFLHEPSELAVNIFKLIELILKLSFDIRRAKKDALQVHPSALHINPNIKRELELLQFVIPLGDFGLEGLVVRRYFHRSQVVEIFLKLGEEFVPSSNQFALGLILNQFEFEYVPIFLDLQDHIF